MKTVVFAYHDMGLAGLEALARAGMEILAVFSHDDDPDENCWFGSVSKWALDRGIPLYCPEDVNRPEWISRIAAFAPEMIFSFYYRRMFSEKLLGLASTGAFNLHGSLLPSYRGRCPVNWVLIHGETRTGVTLHHMIAKADAGDIVGQKAVPIDRTDRAVTLYRKLCTAAGTLLDELLPPLIAGTSPRIHQDLSKGSYFGGRRPDDGRIDWHWSNERIYNLIRAVTDPYPGAFGFLPGGRKLLIWWAEPTLDAAHSAPTLPGMIHRHGGTICVETGHGLIRLIEVEVDGERISGEILINHFKELEGIALS